MTPAEILRAAKAKIEDPAHWCQGYSWLNSKNQPISRDDMRSAARRCCAIGAVALSCQRLSDEWSPIRFLETAANELGFGEKVLLAPAELNDSTDHATVMRMFDRAIELAEASQ